MDDLKLRAEAAEILLSNANDEIERLRAIIEEQAATIDKLRGNEPPPEERESTKSYTDRLMNELLYGDGPQLSADAIRELLKQRTPPTDLTIQVQVQYDIVQDSVILCLGSGPSRRNMMIRGDEMYAIRSAPTDHGIRILEGYALEMLRHIGRNEGIFNDPPERLVQEIAREFHRKILRADGRGLTDPYDMGFDVGFPSPPPVRRPKGFPLKGFYDTTPKSPKQKGGR